MSKYVSVEDGNGLGFTHVFSVADWRELCKLCGQQSGEVELSEGLATLHGDTVFITLKSPGGCRIYDLSAADLFAWLTGSCAAGPTA